MRETTSQLRTAVVESLEGRTLLSSAWEGTWSVQGVNLAMVSLPRFGGVAVTSPKMTVAITQLDEDTYKGVFTEIVRGRPADTRERQLELTSDGLVLDYTEQDPPRSNGLVIHWRHYIRMMDVDADVKMLDMSSVGYFEVGGADRIYGINQYAGVASKQKLQVVKFPYLRNYSFNGALVQADASDGSLDVVADYTQSPVNITTGPAKGWYNVQTNTSPQPWPFQDKRGRLSSIVTRNNTQDKTYERYIQQYYRGPKGRLYFRGGGMEVNQNPNRTDAGGTLDVGQMLSGWTMSGYSNVAHNFAPVLTSGTVTLNPVQQGAVNNGTSVQQIVAGSSIVDWNQTPGGIAITYLDRRHGDWEYSTDGGTNWEPIERVSTARALLLANNAQNRIRFVPDDGFAGTLSKGIRFRAWDQSGTATSGTYASAAKVGKLNPFSIKSSYASVVVNPAAAPAALSVFSSTPLPGVELLV